MTEPIRATQSTSKTGTNHQPGLDPALRRELRRWARPQETLYLGPIPTPRGLVREPRPQTQVARAKRAKASAPAVARETKRKGIPS